MSGSVSRVLYPVNGVTVIKLRPAVADRLCRTVSHSARNLPAVIMSGPNTQHTWSCRRWGLPCRRCYQRRGALLPHHFNLTCAPVRKPKAIGGIFSAALSSVGSRPPGITWHSALWSPDFPPYPSPEGRIPRLSSRLPAATILKRGSAGKPQHMVK